MNTILPAFIIGLAGTLHCIGMCSPLVMTVSGSGRNAFFRNLTYKSGRLITYGVLGSIFAFAGQALHFTGFQQGISIAFAVALIAVALTNIPIALPSFLRAPVARFTITLKELFARMVGTRSAFGVLALGMINGLLPCGMTLVALAFCVTLSSPTDGLLAMLAVGAGTLPGTVGFAAAAKSVLSNLRIGFSRMKAALMITCAIILIGRAIWTSDHAAHAAAQPEIVVCESPEGK